MITIDECFLLFELTPNCTKDELKHAYKRLASKYHPDKGGETSLFQHIQYAYVEINKYINKQHNKKSSNIEVELTLEEIFTGKSLYVTVNIDGVSKELLLDVPPGVENGKRIVINNVSVGHDVYVTIKEKKHPRIKRNNDTLLITEHISVFDAMIGCKKTIQVLGELIELNVPSGCENGKMFTYPDRGMRTSNGKRGKLTVSIQYNAPAITDPSNIALIASLQNNLTNP